MCSRRCITPKTPLPVEGMIERDRDAVGAIDVPLAEKALAEGKFTKINGVPVIESEKFPAC